MQNDGVKPFPARQCSWAWILCAEVLQGSLLIAWWIRGASACLPAEPAVLRRAGASCGSALADCSQVSRIQPRPKRSEIPARRSPCTVGRRRESRQGKGCGTPAPEHNRGVARPPGSPDSPTRTDPALGELTYRAADLWGGGGACVCSKQINLGTLLIHRQGSKKLSKAEHRSKTISLNCLFILSFKSMLSREKAELQKHLICVFQRRHMT